MSLDVAVLTDEETIDRYVPIGVETHHRLVVVCQAAGLELMARISDYYSEGEFFHQELPQLEEELRAALTRAQGDPELAAIIGQLVQLAEFARETKRSLVAIPD